ncbi:beta-glucosidase [Microbacteriaceae bacterium SG_E_30_P1]|uniref:Beta-glucosidase n=1 Tax=Antiquaquibacter oligotrophicus TaxID=2880260 RepID=A0ABT6KJZ1_9MICO|nr:family 1 glycosylhydrolase [Antiquaquibacter oligotrophicus]MDH6180322.1 beta-glucosidase [Antiquaquibacter oligotrophicus]UDF13932.1 family 1 glycosylhydrolase [Antiquaquibacter oligotrophicus]
MIDPEAIAARLPPGFLIGVATAATQIEGAIHEGGRGESTWDVFARQPGRIADGSTTEITTDHVHRFREDVALLRDLGVDAYRFSLGWPRILPDGRGPARAEGIAFYDRLLDALLEAGISPVVTLFHWDVPEPLQRAGGWMNRDTAYRLADFATVAAEAFGDRVDKWITLNEPTTVSLNGYALGIHAPGESLLFDSLTSVHHQLLGHGLSVTALRAAGVRGEIGVTNVHSPVSSARRGFLGDQYTRVFDLVHNRIYADPILLGRYPRFPLLARKEFRALRETDPADLAIIHQPLDFYGVNYYMPTRIAVGPPEDSSTPDGEAEAMRDLPFHLAPWPEYPTTGFGWPIAPHFLADTLRDHTRRYGSALPPVYITEGGASFPDAPGPDGRVDDTERISYLAGHLNAALSVPEVDLRGYFVWTLMDNWEWAAGFTQRFGLVHVDFDSLVRTPKASFEWLQRVQSSRMR